MCVASIGESEMRAVKKDSNHQEVVAEFRKLGFSVLDISQLKNCCDLFVAKSGITVAVEVKDGSLPPSKRRLTAGEREFKSAWRGNYAIIESLDHVHMLNANMKNWEKYTGEDL